MSGFLGLPKGSGKLNEISKLDADFFGVSESEANQMDAMIRIMIELTYEAICDSGMSPMVNTWGFINIFNNKMIKSTKII